MNRVELNKKTVPTFNKIDWEKPFKFFRRGQELYEITYVGKTKGLKPKLEYTARCVAHDFGSKRYKK